MKTVGLFGTCAGSQWRVPFEKKITELGAIPYNPVKSNWTPEMLKEESEHLANDDVIVIVLTEESEGYISMVEVGFTISHVLQSGRKAIIYVQDYKEAEGTLSSMRESAWEEHTAREINRARKAIREHLSQVKNDSIKVVSSLDEALNTLEEVINND